MDGKAVLLFQTSSFTRLAYGSISEAIAQLTNGPNRRFAFGKADRQKVESRDWTKAFEEFWQMGN